jgi:tyrosinase
MFERQDVWKLSNQDPWHPTLHWYARAVASMAERDRTDPTSWAYAAAIHGTPDDPSTWPPGATWRKCQHASWYFLPWHRIYLHYFESNVRATVVELGGPRDWALPYWDYSDSLRPEVLTLPPAFREKRLPSGEDNPLYVSARRAAINSGGKLDTRDVSIVQAMKERKFSAVGISGFGGPITDWNVAGGTVGSLENIPHGVVHTGVGGRDPFGWMSSFSTAGMDPVFWLHHANVDRLWEVWLRQPERANPTDARWLEAEFTLGSGAAAVTLAVRDVLDTRRPPLTYRYSGLSGATPGPLGAEAGDARPPAAMGVPPEVVGASRTRIPLTSGTSEVEVRLVQPTGPALTPRSVTRGAEEPSRVHVKIENVTGLNLAADAYLVYVNLPAAASPGAHPEHQVGQISLFGLRESSATDEEHSGSGLTFTFDITSLAARLRAAGDWDPDRLRVVFTPRATVDDPSDDGDVSVGRVSVLRT